MSITDAQLLEYEERGADTIDGPLTDRELDRVEAASRSRPPARDASTMTAQDTRVIPACAPCGSTWA